MSISRASRFVAVVGGGPAGLATAIAMREQGIGVTVFDHAVPPIDKACGEGLMPDALAALARLGVHLDTRHGAPIEGLRFMNGATCAEARFRSGPGLAVRRTRLHEAMVARAAEVGVDLRWGVQKLSTFGGVLAVDGKTIACDLLVGADGYHSQVRRSNQLDACFYRSLRYGSRQHVRCRPWSSFVEVYWTDNKELFVTPVSKEEVGIALLTSDPRDDVDQAITELPRLQARLTGAPKSSPHRGSLTVARRLHHVTRGHIALVGDASGSVDSVTGQGIALACEQAVALASAFADGDLQRYEAEHRRLNRRPRLMMRMLLLLARNNGLRKSVIDRFSTRPELFSRLAEIHTK